MLVQEETEHFAATVREFGDGIVMLEIEIKMLLQKLKR